MAGLGADGVGGVGLFGPVLGAGEAEGAGAGFSVAEESDDFEDIGPGGEGCVIGSFEGVDGDEEEELFLVHFAVFGGLHEVGETASRSSSSFESGGWRRLEVSAVES